jgi:hypothetical protein
MDRSAAREAPVFAGAAVAAGAASVVSRAVDRAEGGSGEGDEEPGAVADCGRDVLAAGKTRADEVEGVTCVESGARSADGCASVAAADEEAFAGFVASVVVVQNLAGRAVQGGG